MIIQTGDLSPQSLYPPDTNNQIYCGLDAMLTLEIWQELQDPPPPPIYGFERALQAPYMEIMQRGFAVDPLARHHAAQALRARQTHLAGVLNKLAGAVWDQPLNPNSPKQLKEFLFERMALPKIWISKKGVRALSTSREALEKLEHYMHAQPIIACVLGLRDIGKQLTVIECDIDPDGRFRAGYNIAGTETGRPSSSENAFGTGGNAQNIAAVLRYVFVADKGYKMAVIDLEQVEARDVGFFCGCLFDDWTFLDACESGDLHTNNAKKTWPERPWTDDPKRDRQLAEEKFYRDFSYRDMAKRGGHLSNYYGSAWTMARSLKIPLKEAEEFQSRYCRGRSCAFPAIAEWWKWTAQQLQTTQQLTTPFGRRRHFFGRPGDDTTLREAIAFLPQSTTADRMNLGLWRVWRKMPHVQLLAQTYDSITFQYPDLGVEYENQVISEALELVRVELTAPNGRRYVVPGEAKIGWNWAAKSPDGKNPEGLMKWSPSNPDRRQRSTGLDRVAF